MFSKFNEMQQAKSEAEFCQNATKGRVNKDSCSEGVVASDEDLQEIKNDDEILASPFNEPNIVLVFGKRKLYLQKEHLINVSPVFEAMFSSKFMEGSMKEIPLPDKKLSHFVHFLRYLSPGFEDELTDATIHHMLPLAEKYQTNDLKERIEKFLIKGVLSKSDSITSVQIIIKNLEAEKYRLNCYLTACIDVASRKKIQSLKKCSKFEEISQKTQLKIAFKRMEDIDKIYNNAIEDRIISDGQSGWKFGQNQFSMEDLGTHLKPYMLNN